MNAPVATYCSPTMGTTAGNVPQAPTPFRLGRRPCLDGIRGVAALLVFGYHFGILSGYLDAPAFGFNGLFFVLSGFLITTMLVEEWGKAQTIRLRRVYARRALHLIPGLVLVLLAAILVIVVGSAIGDPSARLVEPDMHPRWLGLGAELGFATNWALACDLADPGPPRGTWSLAMEQQFYVLWPPALALMLRRNARFSRLALTMALGAVALAVYREAIWHQGASWQRVYFAADTRADGILIGCVVGLLIAGNLLLPGSVSFRHGLRLAFYAAAAFLGILAVLLVLPIERGARSVDAAMVHLMGPIGVATAVILLYLVVEPQTTAARLLGARWLGVVGRMSYGIYLWHTFYFWLCLKLIGYSGLSALTMVVMTVISAPLAYFAVELPLLRLKSRVGGGTVTPVAPSSNPTGFAPAGESTTSLSA